MIHYPYKTPNVGLCGATGVTSKDTRKVTCIDCLYELEDRYTTYPKFNK